MQRLGLGQREEWFSYFFQVKLLDLFQTRLDIDKEQQMEETAIVISEREISETINWPTTIEYDTW